MTQDAFRLAKRMRLSLDSSRATTVSDTDLLQRFLADREDEAFAQLVQRHGPLVWGLCQRLMHHHADAEDAFQATFLTLFQHAGRIQKQTSLASWLYGVACRTAYKIKRTRARAQQREWQMARPEKQTGESSWDQTIRDVMDDELARLPAHYREPLLLCYLQGQSHALAAQTLGWPIGTVAGRLSRAKELLRSRLIRRGVAPAVAAGMSFDLAQAHLPIELIEKTLHTIHTGETSTLTLLTKGAVTTMVLTKWLTAAVTGVALIVGAGFCYSAFSMQGESKKESAAENQPTMAKQKAAQDDYQLIQGQWRCDIRHEVTNTLQMVEELTFRGRKYATSIYKGDKNGGLGEQISESQAFGFVLDSAHSPKLMELQLYDDSFIAKIIKSGRVADHVCQRILCHYELTGDMLTISYGDMAVLKVTTKGELTPDPNSPQAYFPKPGDPNVKKRIYRRQTPDFMRGQMEDRILKMLRTGEVAHALTLPNTPIRKTIIQGDRVNIVATTKVADQNGTIKTIYLLEDIEVLAVDHTINKDGAETDATRVILRLTRPESLTLKYHQDNSRLDVVMRKATSSNKVADTEPSFTDSTKTVSDAERKLLEEQIKACEVLVDLRLKAYKSGQENANFILEAIKNRTEAKLDLAGNNPPAIRTILNEALSSTKYVEAVADAKYKAGSATLLEATTPKADRLKYELQLLRLEKTAK